MCLNLDYNPHAPQRAGAPGLFNTCGLGDRTLWTKIQRVIVRVMGGLWIYLGQYELI